MRAAGEAGSTRDYVRGSVRLEVLRASVPCVKAATEAALQRLFAQLQEYTLQANERALESVPRRLGAELLCWGRRCDQTVAVPSAWLVASGARFVAGCAHRREVLTHALGPLWAAEQELATLERELAPSAPAPDRASERTTPLWVVDFRRMRSPTAAMCGAIPVCSLDGQTLDEIPAEHAAAMRERSPRLADALRMGAANHEFWREHAEEPETVEAASIGVDAAVFREQVAAFVRTPGAVACKSCVYLLDTWVPDGACPHRPGALASQVYVGIVGSKEGDQLVNTVGKRMLQHLAGDELLVDLEMQNPELRRCAFAGPGRRGPQPAMLLLPLDFGTPGLHGKHSVGHLEGVYMRYFDCVSPLGLNATRSRGERAYSQAAWALFVSLNAAYVAACVTSDSPCALLPPGTPPLPPALLDGLRASRAEAHTQLLEFVTAHGDLAQHGPLPDGVAGVPFQALLDRAIELNVVCMDAYKTTAKQRALYGANAETLLKAQRTGCGAALNTDLIHDSTGENGNYAFWHRATHDSWSLTRLLFPRNPAKVTDAELLAAMAEAKAAREAREAQGGAAGRAAAASEAPSRAKRQRRGATRKPAAPAGSADDGADE